MYVCNMYVCNFVFMLLALNVIWYVIVVESVVITRSVVS